MFPAIVTEPQTHFLGTSKTGASSAKATQRECPPGVREQHHHFLPRDSVALQNSAELDTPRSPLGNTLSEGLPSREARLQAAEPFPAWWLCCGLSPGTAEGGRAPSCLSSQTPPPPPPEACMGRPQHSSQPTALHFLP